MRESVRVRGENQKQIKKGNPHTSLGLIFLLPLEAQT